MITIGFVGKVMNEANPSADMRTAIVSKITDYTGVTGKFESNQIVWHTALTSKGTSGSPIFNTDGKVIAINNGGLSAREILVRDEVTRKLRKDVAYEATGLNIGVRVDTLRSMLE